ncbi:MAG: NUDIX domain-containing protein [Patescibacteria group bacterium]
MAIPLHISNYLAFLETLPEACRKKPVDEERETWIATDPDLIQQVEAQDMEKYRKLGLNPEDARVGIRSISPVAWLVMDVIFVPGPKPKDPGTFRTWSRVLWKNGVHGKSVIIVAIGPDGRLALIPADRHPSQRWELEFPGGGLTGAKAWEDAVKLQTLEEAGHQIVGAPIPLEPDFGDTDHGSPFIVDPSTNGTPIRTFAVHLGVAGEPRPQFGEVMDRPLFFDYEELEDLYWRGTMPHPNRPGVTLHVRTGRNAHAMTAYRAAKRAGIL